MINLYANKTLSAKHLFIDYTRISKQIIKQSNHDELKLETTSPQNEKKKRQEKYENAYGKTYEAEEKKLKFLNYGTIHIKI